VSGDGRIKRTDNDDENAMTLLQVAHQKLRLKEIVKAQELYSKSLKLATEATNAFKESIGWHTKKHTDEMWLKLRRNAQYNAMAQASAGLAMCEMANRNFAPALEIVTKIREDFPYATKDLKDVTEAIVRIELVFAAKFDLDKDNYVTLMKFEDSEEDPVKFYEQHVKLAVAHVIDKKHRAAIIECVRLIRSESKLLPVLKQAGVVEKDAVLASNVSTPARRVIFLIFEVLGPHHETTIEGRKMLEPYL
jgi:tetratricopeptide (TPR) repeat protein